MKKSILNLFFSLVSFSIFGMDCSFFQFGNYSACDYFTGSNYFSLAYYNELKNIEKVKEIDEYNKKVNEEWNSRYFYNSSLLIREETDLHDFHVRVYNYDMKNNLTSINEDDCKFIYKGKNQRKCYANGKFLYQQTIKNQNNIYTLIIENFNPKINDLSIREKSVYTYNGKRIQKYDSTSYDRLGEISNIMTFDFQYNADGNINFITVKGHDFLMETETWNTIVSFEYDKNQNMCKIINDDLKNKKESSITEFSDYDDYGNWHIRKIFRNGKLHEETYRKIRYL